jgi:D-alanyl-D-alanine dipeptidase
LRDIDESIVQEMRYYGNHNFMGRRVPGYEAGECILTRRAAQALRSVQARLRDQRRSLKVHDCYRPARAGQSFAKWAKDASDTTMKGEFYAAVDKRDLFRLGYIAVPSSHSRGSAVDLTIVPLEAPLPPHRQAKEALKPCHLDAGKRFPDNVLDFGTGWDCFHSRSATNSREISSEAQINRRQLVEEMRRAGFVNYHREWWHFMLRNEPFPGTTFDFPIKPRKQ